MLGGGIVYCGLAHWVTGYTAVPHHSRQVHVPRRGLMQQASIVPDHGVAGGPIVMISARRAACEVHQLLQEPIGLRGVHSRNIVSMATNHERLSPGFRMDLHQRAQRNGAVVEAVAAICAAGFRLMPELRLAVVERVVRGEAFDSRAEIVIESVV